jgi:hypothetical protein
VSAERKVRYGLRQKGDERGWFIGRPVVAGIPGGGVTKTYGTADALLFETRAEAVDFLLHRWDTHPSSHVIKASQLRIIRLVRRAR